MRDESLRENFQCFSGSSLPGCQEQQAGDRATSANDTRPGGFLGRWSVEVARQRRALERGKI